MIEITLQMMRKSLKMLIASGIAVLVGSMFITSTFLFSNGVNDVVVKRIGAGYGKANYIVDLDSKVYPSEPKSVWNRAEKSENPDDKDKYVQRTVADYKLDKIRAIDGVEGYQYGNRFAAKLSANDRYAGSVVVANPYGNGDMLPVKLTEGRLPQHGREIAISTAAAKTLKTSIGKRLKVEVRSFTGDESKDDANGDGIREGQVHHIEVEIVGITKDPYGVFASSSGACVASDDVIAQLSGKQHVDDVEDERLFVKVAPSKVEHVIAQIRSLAPYFQVNSVQSEVDRQIRTITSYQTPVIVVCLLTFGTLAMFIAAMVIANTFQVLVAQRRRMLALLRTIGASSKQLYYSVLSEGAMLGLVASVLGVLAGFGLMSIAFKMTTILGVAMPEPTVVLTWPTVVVPIVFSVIITVIASTFAARIATKVSPLEAMRPLDVINDRQASVKRGIIGFVSMAIGAIMTAYSVMNVVNALGSNGSGNYENLLFSSVCGCCLILVGLLVTAVFWMPFAMRGFAFFVSLIGPSAKVAAANIRRNPRRISATGTALLIGVTLVSTVATGAVIAKATLAEALDKKYSVDLSVRGADVNDKVAQQISGVHGVKRVLLASVVSVNGQVNKKLGNVTDMIAVESLDRLKQVIHAPLYNAKLDDNTAIVPKKFDNHAIELKKGKFTFSKIDGVGKPQEISAVQDEYRSVISDFHPAIFVTPALMHKIGVKADERVLLVSIDAQPAELSNVIKKINEVVSSLELSSLNGPIAQRARWDQAITVMFMVLLALLAVAVIIALIGVANTLSLSVIERTRESATLRAIGMTRGQIRRSIACEAIVVAFTSSVIGMAFGSIFGWIGSYMVFTVIGHVPFAIDWQTFAIVLVISILAALLASVLPARRATKSSPILALAEE